MSLSTYFLECGCHVGQLVVFAAVVICTRPQAIPLAMITMLKSTHGFLFLSYISMGLAALRAAGALLLITTCSNKLISLSDHVKFLSAAMFDLPCTASAAT